MVESLGVFLATLPRVLNDLVCSYIHPAFFELARGTFEDRHAPFVAQYYMKRFSCDCAICLSRLVARVSEIGLLPEHCQWNVYPVVLQYICAGLGTAQMLTDLQEKAGLEYPPNDEVLLEIAIQMDNESVVLRGAVDTIRYLRLALEISMKYRRHSIFAQLMYYPGRIACLECKGDPAEQIEFIKGADKHIREEICAEFLTRVDINTLPADYAIFLISEAGNRMDPDSFEEATHSEVRAFISTLIATAVKNK